MIRQKDKIIELVESKYKQRRALKQRLEMQWSMNKLAYQGYQWLDPLPTLDDWTLVRVNDEINPGIEFTANLIVSTVQNLIALLTKSKPRIIVMPRTNDEEDKNRARYTDTLSEYAWQSYQVPTKLLDLLLDELICGTSFLKIYWDDGLGRSVDRLSDISTSADEFGNIISEDVYSTEREGDVAVVPVSSFNIIKDPFALKLIDSRWLLHFYLRNLEELEWKYPKFVGKIQADANEYSRTLEYRVAQATQFDIDTSQIDDKAVIVKEAYIAPCKDYPHGLWAKTAGGQLLEEVEIEPDDWHFVDFHYIKNPSEFWSETIITHLLQSQRAINVGVSQTLQYRDTFLNGAWINPLDSGVDNSELTNAPDLIIRPNSGSVPTKIPPPEMPHGLLVIDEYMMNIYAEISRISDATRGKNPPGNRSAEGLLTMQESDALQLMSTVTYLEQSLTQTFKKILKTVKENYSDDRKIAIVGKNRTPEVYDFNKDWIVEEDITIELGSMLPQSKYAQQQLYLGMWNQSIIRPEERDKLLEGMGMGQFMSFTEDVLAVQNEIKEENRQLMEGKYPSVFEWQNHKTHMEEHAKFATTFSFKESMGKQVGMMNVPQQPPGMPPQGMGPEQPGMQPGMPMGMPQQKPVTIGDMFNQHYKEHKMAIQNAILEAQAIQAKGMQMQSMAQASGMQAQGQVTGGLRGNPQG